MVLFNSAVTGKHLDHQEDLVLPFGTCKVFCMPNMFIDLACRLGSCGIDSHGLKLLFVTEELDCLGLGLPSLYLQEYFLIWIGQDRNSGWVSPIKIHRFVMVGVTTFCCILVMSY